MLPPKRWPAPHEQAHEGKLLLDEHDSGRIDQDGQHNACKQASMTLLKGLGFRGSALNPKPLGFIVVLVLE